MSVSYQLMFFLTNYSFIANSATHGGTLDRFSIVIDDLLSVCCTNQYRKYVCTQREVIVLPLSKLKLCSPAMLRSASSQIK